MVNELLENKLACWVPTRQAKKKLDGKRSEKKKKIVRIDEVRPPIWIESIYILFLNAPRRTDRGPGPVGVHVSITFK